MYEFYAKTTEARYSFERVPVLKIEGCSVHSSKLIDSCLHEEEFGASIFIPMDKELAGKDLNKVTFKVTVEVVE